MGTRRVEALMLPKGRTPHSLRQHISREHRLSTGPCASPTRNSQPVRDTDTHTGVQPATTGKGPEGSRWGGCLAGTWGSLREDLPKDGISKISEA